MKLSKKFFWKFKRTSWYVLKLIDIKRSSNLVQNLWKNPNFSQLSTKKYSHHTRQYKIRKITPLFVDRIVKSVPQTPKNESAKENYTLCTLRCHNDDSNSFFLSFSSSRYPTSLSLQFENRKNKELSLV